MPSARPARRHPRALLALLLALALLAPTIALAPAARAADCQVTTGADSGAGSLRALLAGACTTITFASNVTEVDITSDLAINRQVTIQGPGAAQLAIKYTGPLGSTTGVVFSISGGPVALSGLTVTGGSSSAVYGAGLSVGASSDQPAVTLSLAGVVVSGNTTTAGPGGGLYATHAALTITNSVFSGNEANGGSSPHRGGGGIFLDDTFGSVTASLTDTTIVGNSTTTDGGGIAIVHNGMPTFPPSLAVTLTRTTVGTAALPNRAAGAGGGILEQNAQLTVTESTVSGNTAGDGGGIAVEPHPSSGPGALALTNSTISGNVASGTGGGIYAQDIADLTLTAMTLVGNHAVSGGGLALRGFPSSVPFAHLAQSIVAGNLANGTPQDCQHLQEAGANTLISDGHNLTGQGTGCPTGGAGDILLAAALATVLNPTLADNGGPQPLPHTSTHNLVPGSPAIDAGGAACPSTDQRGITRPQGAACDIGAVEYQAAQSSPSPACGTRFGDVPASAPACAAIEALAARGVINGCDSSVSPPLFCPNDPTLREQMAALIVRAIPAWAGETGLPNFSDNTTDTELMTRVGTLQRHSVVRGYQDEVCTSQGKTPPCFGPLDTVKYGQVLLFIARAMVADTLWTLQPDDRTIFPDQNGAAGADPDHDQQTLDHRAVVTYIHYVGNPPDVADVHAPFLRAGVAHGGWGDDSDRAWFARAFYPAIKDH